MAKNRENKRADARIAANAPAPVVEASPSEVPSVSVTIEIPLHWEEPLLKALGVTHPIDGKAIAENPAAARHLLRYGIGRFTRDGCTPEEEIGEGDAKRKATDDERRAEATKLATDKWARLLAGTLRQRVGGASDPVLTELRTIVVKALVKRNVARKAIPKLPDRAAIEAACKAHEGLYVKALALAEKVVAARGGDDI